MFRSKKDVDRHVQSIFSKLRNENEKNLRCYNVAKLYYQVGDYESTKRYVCNYLEVREDSAGAHKLLGQAYEALGQKEAAFNEYKISLEIEGRQDDLVLKVCELLTDNDIAMDVNKINYWVDRADKQFPHHPLVFQLKEKLTVERPNSNTEDLEKLIISELDARPNDVQLHIKLLNYYMQEHKLDKAYEHATRVEATVCYKDSIVWYQLLCELLTKCKPTKYSDCSFWFLYITALDRYAGLCLKEHGNHVKKSVADAAQAVFNFDQSLKEMKSRSFSKQHSFTKHLFMHMWGQLHFHLACLLLRKTKREQGSWSEAGRLCAPLFLTALHVAPLESRTFVHLENGFKDQFKLWSKEGAYRCCQAGYILRDYARDTTKKLLDRIDKFCVERWRERLYQRIFVTKLYLDRKGDSFFCSESIFDPPLRLCSPNQLKSYNQTAQEMWPDSLHHQIWFGIEHRPDDISPYPNQYSVIFPDLQFSVFNTNQAAPESLCLLDVDAFLNAAIICASSLLQEQHMSSFMNPEKLPTLPVDLTMTLSTSNQEKWWTAAYKMYSKRENVDCDIGELRKELQQGLEIVRCIGSHGMHPVLLVGLARIFHYRAQKMDKDEESDHVTRLMARSELYWTVAMPMLERLQNNQTLCMSSSKLFNYQGTEMNNFELTHSIEKGKLLLAQRFVREKQYEQAIDALQALKCPDASLQQGKIYKLLADEIVNSTPRESLTSEMRSQHIIMLSKARNCFYLTLDRLRSPGTQPKHPLNSELATYITDIENEMKRIDPEDLGRGDLSRNDIDDLSDESYSPAHSTVDQTVHVNSTLPLLTTGGSNMLSTPQRNAHRTPKHASTPCKAQHQDYLNLSKIRIEARPSPERLDAQIRQIMHSRDNEMQELTEQMKNLMDQTKSMMSQMKTLTDKVDNLTKEVTESRKENQKQQQQQQQQRIQQQQNVNPPVDPDDFYVLDDDEYADLNYQNQPTGPASSISGNIFASQHRHPYSSLLYPSAATAFQGYYQGGIPFTDPNAQAALPPLYPPVYPMPVLYPNANQSKVSDNPLQQGLFASTLSSQLPDLMPVAAAAAAAANPSLQIPLQQKIEAPRAKPETPTTTIIKDAPVNKTPPVNVVITTSDTLPTTVPSTQPTLSVTIPPQYRLGGGAAVTFSSSTPETAVATATAPTAATTITTKSSNVPHCYQIPMPSQATIPTTVNLPPTTIYVTPDISVPPVYTSNLTFSTLSSITTTQSTTGSQTKTLEKPIYEPIESPNTSTEICEQEHDPIPDFVPVIPLPAKVKVFTGEEDEETLYCGRAKLFRFVEKEWKERGVGYVKLLRNAEGKVRLLMRRDQVLKICANHMLRSDMELTPMSNNNKAWCWVANDFADEAVKLEKLCIRFKTADEATAFKEAFDKAKLSLIASPVKPSKIENKAPSSNNKDMIKTQKSQPTQQANVSSTIEITSSNQSKPGTTTLGGFSFSSKPIIQEVSEPDDFKKSEEPPKVSPFSGFSFVKSPSKPETPMSVTMNAMTQSKGFVFAASAISQPSDTAGQNTASTESSVLTSPVTSGQTSTTLRRPRLPPPGGAKSKSNSEAWPQIESEQKLFDGRVSIQCQSISSGSNKQWKSKGTGPIMLLLDVKSGKLRFMLTDDKSCEPYGHHIPPDMAFTHKSGTVVVNWTVPEEPGKTWLLHAATFATSDMASQFYNVVSSVQQKLMKGCNPGEIAKEFEKTTSSAPDKSQPPPLSQLFKPPTGSWECGDCYTRNNATDTKCIACEAPSPSAASNKNDSAVVSKPADSSKPPLSELFKAPAGSWTCTGCYIVNSGSNIYCVACDSPKDPSQPPKPQQASIFHLNVSGSPAATPMTTFSFGIPKDAAKETTNTGFTFRMPKAEDKSTSGNIKTTPSKTEETASTNFVFGMPIKTAQNSGESPFTFNSPAKSFGFNFTAKSPAKSPGGGETSEDEVVESEDIHFSPIVPLPDKIEVKTGEEDEEVIYSHRAKLFRFDTEVKEWKERGLGDIKLLRHKETGKLRLIMRRDHVLKLCLNHMLTVDLEFTPKDEKTWLWTTADYSEGEIEYMQFACRFKTAEIAMNFKKAIDDVRKNAKPVIVSEKVNKAAAKTPAKMTEEIEIVYEAKVTPEEKAAALKLQLPENFYVYKQKEDCPGCIGCRKPSIVLYSDVSSQETKLKPVSEEKKLSSNSKSNESSQSAPQSVKNGFSFAMAPSPTFKTTTPVTSSIFDGSTMSFGTGDLKLFNDKKTTTFSFGMNPQFGANEATENTTSASLENVKICSPSNIQVTQTTIASNTTGSTTGQSIFSQAAASIFKTSNFTFDSSKNIFGGASKTSDLALPKTSIFGENSDSNSLSFGNSTPSFSITKTTSAVVPVTTNSILKTSPLTTSSTFGTGSFLFGASTPQTLKANDTAPTSTTAFDASNQSSISVFTTSSTPFSKITFGNTTSPFGTSTTATNIFGETTATTNIFSGTTNIFAKPSDDQKNEDQNTNLFSGDNVVSFAAIAAAATAQPEAFKIDPNFQFAGAGSSVFGSKPVSSSLNSSETVQNKSHNESVQKEDNEEDDGEDNEQEHDPHFEPIIPLPDAIEVRTGEEDEEKVFYHRAKLYRFDNATKEWKERGVGEMKILYHAGHGTYRLLLRREQVHKVVCNFLLTPDVEFRPLATSDQAWMWAGINYADQEPCAEQLAVKFKSSDLARQFKAHIDAIQQELRGKKNLQDETCVGEVQESEEHDQGNDVDEEEEDEEEEDEEDDQEMLPIIEKPATMFARWPNDVTDKWECIGIGNLAIYYDSEIYAERIILKLDDSGEYASNTIISMDTVMQVKGEEIIWSGIDYALEPPVRRVLKAVFSSMQAAQEMFSFYEDALDSASQAGVVEYQEE